MSWRSRVRRRSSVLESIDVRAQQSSSSISAGESATAACGDSSRTQISPNLFMSVEVMEDARPIRSTEGKNPGSNFLHAGKSPALLKWPQKLTIRLESPNGRPVFIPPWYCLVFLTSSLVPSIVSSSRYRVTLQVLGQEIRPLRGRGLGHY